MYYQFAWVNIFWEIIQVGYTVNCSASDGTYSSSKWAAGKSLRNKGKNLLYQRFYKINMLFTILVAYNESTTVNNLLQNHQDIIN
jgi:hypothetical protein